MVVVQDQVLIFLKQMLRLSNREAFFISASAALKFFKTKKGKKESTFRGADFCGCKLFDLKIFLLNILKDKYQGFEGKNFKRNPEGLNLQERKASPYLGCIFLFLIH